jgi:polysaccharide biosynthesis protein PslH
MRLLFLSHVIPLPIDSGYKMRTWSVLRSLVATGHKIHLLVLSGTLEGASHDDEMRRVCETVEVISHTLPSLSDGGNYRDRLTAISSPLPYNALRFRCDEMALRIQSWLKADKLDGVLSDTIYPLINVPTLMRLPLILNCHNVEHLILSRYLHHERNPAKLVYAWTEYRKMKVWENSGCSRADLVLACSESDRELLNGLCPKAQVAVVPNTINLDSYRPCEQDDGRTVLYTGGMDWYPNRDAVQFFISEILPLLRQLVPSIRFIVAGRNPEQFRSRFSGIPGLEFTNNVPDMRNEIAKATICVVPLRIGSGTRLKILEAGAMAKPVVSTRIGAEGLQFVDGEEIILKDKPEAFAKVVAELLNDAERRVALGKAARRCVERQYTIAAIQPAVCDALAGVFPKFCSS